MPKMPIAMPLRMPGLALPGGMENLIPPLAVLLALALNVSLLLGGGESEEMEEIFQPGVAVLGRVMPLPERAMTPPSEALAAIPERPPAQPAPPRAEPPPPRVEVREVPRPIIPPADMQPPPPPPVRDASTPREGNGPLMARGFIVQVGSFVRPAGAATLAGQLRERGFEPVYTIKQDEQVQVNIVQAGPFATRLEAREAEIKLLAAGYQGVRINQTLEGHTLDILRELLLVHAIREMEEIEQLDVQRLRIVKGPDYQTFHKVVLGVFPSRREALAESARLTNLGLAIPIVKLWEGPDQPGEWELEG